MNPIVREGPFWTPITPQTGSFFHAESQVLLLKGDIQAGFEHLERMWPPEQGPVWDGRPLRGETVLLHRDPRQGFGDVIQFARYAPMVAARGARVVMASPPELHRILKTLPGVRYVFSRSEYQPWFDYHIGLMRLPRIFGTTLETIPVSVPYLTGDPAPFRDFLATLPGLKVGLCWAGKARVDQDSALLMDQRRSMHLADMAPLFEVPGVSWVSLQVGAPAAQIRAMPNIHDVMHRLRDYADTAALLAGLDLVISVDTSVVHLAGALGRPVWLLNRKDTCWRWFQERADSPWYPTMRIFRQPELGDWGAVIAGVTRALGSNLGSSLNPVKPISCSR